MVSSLLYVSQSTLRQLEQAAEVDRIVEVAQSRNTDLGVTGSLIFTESRFAQILEGPRAAIEELMSSIRRDPRHRDVNVVLTEDLPARRFPYWALAYNGPSIFVDRHVKPLLQQEMNPADRELRAGRLLRLMVELTQTAVSANDR
jgi:hypothetical protein